MDLFIGESMTDHGICHDVIQGKDVPHKIYHGTVHGSMACAMTQFHLRDPRSTVVAVLCAPWSAS